MLDYRQEKMFFKVIFAFPLSVHEIMLLMIIPQKSFNPVLQYVQGIIPDQNGAMWKWTTQVPDLGHCGAGKGECVT